MPFIVIGTGGIGIGIVKRLRLLLERNPKTATKLHENRYQLLGIDIEENPESQLKAQIPMVNFEIADPQTLVSNRAQDPSFKIWWPDPGNQPFMPPTPIKGDFAGGRIRCCGRLALYNNASKVQGEIHRLFSEARQLDPKADRETRTIFVVSSLSGGTGSGILVDVCQMVRREMNPEEQLYSLLLSPTAVCAFAPQGVLENGLAALTEIERWMTVPSGQFSFKYSDADLQAGSMMRPLADAVFLFSGYNMDGRTFAGSPDIMADNFKLHMAQVLYTLVATESFWRDIAANHFNKLTPLSAYRGRCRRYASLAMSSIVFPRDKLLPYCRARFVGSHLTAMDIAPPLEPVSEIEAEHEISIKERDNGRLTAALRTWSAHFQSLAAKHRGLRDRFEKTKTGPNFKAIAVQNKIVSVKTLDTTWEDFFQGYRKDVQVFLAERRARVMERIAEGVKRALPTLNFAAVEAWLGEWNGALMSEIEHLSKSKAHCLDQVGSARDGLETAYSAAVRAGRVFGGFANRKNEYLEKLDKWIAIEVNACEYDLQKRFFQDLLADLAAVSRAVEALSTAFAQSGKDASTTIGNYTTHDWLINPEKFTQGEYVMNVQVGVTSRIINEELMPRVEKSALRNNIRTVFTEGVSDDLAGIQIRPLAALFTSACEEAKVRQTRFVAESGSKYGEEIRKAIEWILHWVDDALADVTVDDALGWYFDELMGRVAAAEKVSGDERVSIQTQLGFIFGEGGARDLVREKKRDEWHKKALNYLFRRMCALTSAFWRIDTDARKQAFSKTGKDEYLYLTGIRRAYCHPDFRYRSAIEITGMGVPVEIAQTDETQRVLFLHFEGGATLGIMTDLKEAAGKYQEALESETNGTASWPVHTDRRFWYEWRDDIMAERTQDQVKLIYALGIGTEVITKRPRGFAYGTRPLGSSLRSCLEKLVSDSALCSKVAKDVFRRIDDIPGKTRLLEVQKHFIKANSIHSGIKPPRTVRNREDYLLWEDVARRIQIEQRDDRTDIEGDLVPRDDAELKVKVMDQLRAYLSK